MTGPGVYLPDRGEQVHFAVATPDLVRRLSGFAIATGCPAAATSPELPAWFAKYAFGLFELLIVDDQQQPRFGCDTEAALWHWGMSERDEVALSRALGAHHVTVIAVGDIGP